MSDKLLTIAMATYDDYDGVFFSVQSLRIYHQLCRTDAVQFMVLDGNPNSEHGKACKSFIENQARGKYISYHGVPSSFNKYKTVDNADGKYVLIMDCHVILEPNAISSLIDYFAHNPDCKDLIQGPLWYDDLVNISTHFDQKWSGDMYGTWQTNKLAYDKGDPFEIEMQGMGLLAFEKSAWKGINPHFRGFGAEEGYIAAKFKEWGGRNICLPSLKWNHRFGRPNGVKYPLILEDRIWNYFVGWLEITKDPNHPMIQDIQKYFSERIPAGSVNSILQSAIEKILN